MQGVFEGFGGGFDTIDYSTPDWGVLDNLERNVYTFSGAKNYQTIKQLTGLLKDGDRLRTFSEFRREAMPLLDEWNGIWKRTEYDTAMLGATNARNWERFEQQKHIMPLLRFVTVGDERVCAICHPYDGLTRPVDDPCWRYATPVLHFKDRCLLEQVPDANATMTPHDKIPDGEGIPKMFRVNLAKEQLAFPPEHPYYDGVPKKLLKQFVKQNKPKR